MTAILLALLSLLLSPAPPPDAAAAARPLVLLVHGRGDLGDTAAFRRGALRAFARGAESLVGGTILRDDDVRVIWYADLLGDAAANRSSTAGTGAAPRRLNADGCLAGPALGEPAAVDILSMVAGALLEFGTDDLGDLPRRALRAMAGDIRFLGDRAARCIVEQRIGNALAAAEREGRPVILVAHSLGGLMAWSHLHHRGLVDVRALPPVHRFVTVGSLVGSAEVRQLVFGTGGTLALPHGVTSWVNVVDEDDPFAASLFTPDGDVPFAPARRGGADAARAPMRDVLTERQRDDVHELFGYLRDRAATQAILGAWCDAAGSTMTDRAARSACATLALL